MTRYRDSQGWTGASGSVKGSRKGRAALFIAGAGTAAYGLSRRDWPGRALAFAGSALMYRAASAAIPSEISCVVSQTINRSPSDVYSFCRDFNNWPLFMKSLKTVRATGAGEVMGEFEGVERRFEILEDSPSGLHLRAEDGNAVCEAGIAFRPAPGNRGTEVQVSLRSRDTQTLVWELMKSTGGASLEQQSREGLRAMKQLLEVGEVATTDGQPRGSRGMRGRVLRKVLRESVDEREHPAREVELPNQQLIAS